jgi:PAS domain S-box-containing protein
MPRATSKHLAACLTLTRAIRDSAPLEEIFEAALDAVGQGLDSPVASILLFDAHGVLRFKRWRGLSDAYRQAAEGHSPWGSAPASAEPVVLSEGAEDPALALLLAATRDEGVATAAFVPLVSAGVVIGTLALYYPLPRKLTSDELTLARIISGQVAPIVGRTPTHVAAARSEGHRAVTLDAAAIGAAIIESSDDAIVSKDLGGVIKSWNRAAEAMFGYSQNEALGHSITLIIPKERLSEEDMVLRRIRAGERVDHFETVRRRRDGSLLDVSITVSPIRDGEVIVGCSKIARDITSRKRSEAELADLHRRLTTLIAASASLLDSPDSTSVQTATIALARELLAADAHAVWRIDGPTGGWHPVGTEGLSAQFATRVISSYRGAAVPFSEPLAFEDVTAAPMLEGQLTAYRDEGIRSMLVCPLRLSANRAGTLVFYYRAQHHFSGVEVQTAQALANLAAAAMTTAELYDEQRRQRETAEAASRQAAFVAEVGAVLSQSLKYENTLAAVARLAVPEIADWCAVDIVTDDGQLERLAVAHVDPAKVEYARLLQQRYPSDPERRGGVHEVIRTGKPAMMTTIPPGLLTSAARDEDHLRILNELALTSYVCVPLLSGGRAFGAITFVSAESGRQYTEQDLVFAQDLAGRASMAIENAHAYQRAHEANRVKDEFLATLSHELRTPLNAILGYAQMLGMDVLDETRRARAIDVLTRNAESLKTIIEDVLDVSRIMAGKLRLNVQPVDLANILANALGTVQPAADAKGVRLEPIVETAVPPVSGDPDRLQQIVWNLLSNAVKFTPRGGRVQLRLQRVNSHVEIVVSDTGDGIERSFLPHLFERFRQAEGHFARERGGLGLGLSIVRELVQLHGGTVVASSDGPGTGSTFWVKLPLMIVHPDPARDEPRVHPRTEQYIPSVQPVTRLDGIRVLAVDDEEDALGLLRVILESAGAQVTTVGSGAGALEELRTGRHDALVADIGMPQMDGLELLRTIRQTLPAPTNAIPAAALTAYARSEDRVQALKSGFQMHLAKPVSPAELVIAVASLARKSSRTEHAS